MSIKFKNISKLAMISMALFCTTTVLASTTQAATSSTNTTGSGSQQLQIPVTATVVSGCTIGSLNGNQAKLDFGKFSTLDQPINAQTTLVIRCTGADTKGDTNSLQPTLSFSSKNAAQSNGQGPALTMAGNDSNPIIYKLYSDNTDTLTVPHGAAKAQPVKLGNYTIYAQIPANQKVTLKQGEYSDSLTATLSW